MRMKRMIAGALSAAMALAFTACGGGNSGSGTADGGGAGSSSSGGTLEVKIWDGEQLDGIQQICDLWTAESGVKVNVQAMGWGEYFTLLEAGASGGQMPDVFWMHSTVADLYMSNDMLLNLDGYIANDGPAIGLSPAIAFFISIFSFS